MHEHTRDFLFAPAVEMNDAEAMRAENIRRFATHVSFIEAAVQGGKLTVKEATKQIKDHYKAWKSSQTALKKENT